MLATWFIFPGFGILFQDKSGSPAWKPSSWLARLAFQIAAAATSRRSLRRQMAPISRSKQVLMRSKLGIALSSPSPPNPSCKTHVEEIFSKNDNHMINFKSTVMTDDNH
jgi:hypothetical protein